MTYIVPILLVAVLVCAIIRKVNVYDSFVCGAKKSFELSMSVFPCLAATFIMMNVFSASGLNEIVVDFLQPFFQLLGVPREVVNLILLRPFSGSGSLAILSDVYKTYGTDSYVGRCASVIMGSSETVFYVASVYFSQTKVKRTGCAIPIALACNFVGSVLACLLCKIF